METLQGQLKSLLHYDPETGVFTWAVDRGHRIKAGQVAGGIDSNGYVSIGVCLKEGGFTKVYGSTAHRLAFLYMTGEWPTGVTDHINGVRDDNRWCNLRPATGSQNAQNSAVRASTKSGVKGVQHISKGTWRVQVVVDGIRVYKNFSSFEEAVAQVKRLREELHCEFSRHS